MNDDSKKTDEQNADRQGDIAGDPQRGGRLPTAEGDKGDEPRPADESARSAIPSKSFNL